MSHDLIIEKIKKLLRMKRGGTAGEIENALAMAAELARKHGIDLDAVDPEAPEAKPISHLDAVTAARLQDECKYAALVCQNFFNVTALITDCPVVSSKRRVRDFKIIFIGTASDQAIALYIFGFLVGHFRRAWNGRANKRIKQRSAFLNYMYRGLCQKLDEQRAKEVGGVGLIRLDQQVARRDDYMKNNFGETKTQDMKCDSDAKAAQYAGFIAGRKTEIRSGLDGPASGRAELPPARAALPPAAGQLALI